MAGNPKRRQQEAELVGRWEELCDHIAAGLTDKAALAQLGFTSNVIFYRLVRDREDLAAQVVRAREAGADAMAGEALDIVDELVHIKNADPVRVAVARADRRQWLAGARSSRYANNKGSNVAVQVNVQALHLQALRTPALPAPAEVIEAEVLQVLPAPVESIEDLL